MSGSQRDVRPTTVPGTLGDLQRRIQILEAVVPPECACTSGLVISGSPGYDTGYATDLEGTPEFSVAYDYFPENLWHAIDFAFDHWNNIWIVNNHTSGPQYPIFKVTSTGAYVGAFGTPGNGSANGQCNQPNGVCVVENGDIYITDSANNRIQRWDENGIYQSKWGTGGTGNGQFNFGGGSAYAYITYDGTYLYVGDCGNRRVQVFNTSGTYITKWGSMGTGNGQFTTLNGIAVALDGTIYVVDDYYNPGTGNNSRIQHFTNTGTFIDEYISPSYSDADGCFEHPNDIAIDDQDCIYVVDEYNARIQKFQLPGFDFITKWSIPPDLGANPQGIDVRPKSVPI